MISHDPGLAIDVEDLVKEFPDRGGWKGLIRAKRRLALDGVSLQVKVGEVFGLLGPNGAGKTTLMKVLATLVRPNRGAARVNGLDVVADSAAVRRCIGVVYGDERTFFWRLSVRENLRFYGALYQVPPRTLASRVDELLGAVGLADRATVPMYQFSTGMKQRAAIARGLLSDPEILFMDEPTRSLDPVGAHDIWELVRNRVLDERRTVLLCTNNMEEAELLCGRVALINQGKVRLTGTVRELGRTLLAHEQFELDVTGLDHCEVKALTAFPGVLWARPVESETGRWRVSIALETADILPHLIRSLVEHGADIWSCAPHQLSLEEVFRRTVRDDAEAAS